MKYIVYCTTCKVNGKIYIGVHKTKNPDEFDGYIGNGIKIGYSLKNPHTAFQNALKKYGYSNFIRSILYIFDTAEEAYKKEEEIVTLEFVKRRDNYNTCIGGINAGIVHDSLYQYDLLGNFIKEWISFQEAISFYGCCNTRFYLAYKEKRSAFNSYWSKEKYDKLDISEYKKSKHSEIYCYDLNGEFIKLYNTVQEIIEDLKFTKASVEDAMSHKRPLKGYYFLSDDKINIYDLIKTRELVYNLSDKSVSKYSNGKVIQTYPSLSLAAKENKISPNVIKKSIKECDGIWSYGYSKNFNHSLDPVPVKVEQYDLSGNLIKIWDSISKCSKEHPKVKDVLCGSRNQTHGFTFKIIE